MVSSTRAAAPDAKAWWDGLRWVDAARMQVARFSEALMEQAHALADAAMRHRLSQDSDLSMSWRVSMDANYSTKATGMVWETSLISFRYHTARASRVTLHRCPIRAYPARSGAAADCGD